MLRGGNKSFKIRLNCSADLPWERDIFARFGGGGTRQQALRP
jgi:hypothetical protein